MKKLVTCPSSLVTNNGFTLVELAIVLVIVGLMVGMGAGLMGPLTKRAKVYETKEIINAAAESLISFAASNNDLPDTAGFPAQVRNVNDVWGRTLSYIMDDDLKDSALGGICERRSTRLTVNVCPDAACSSPDARTNIAFIILSSGENTNNQTWGTAAVTSTTNVNVYAAEVTVDNYTTDMNRAEPYDDIVKWISLNELRTKAGCSGPQIRILNNELPSGSVGNVYSAEIFASGGVPNTSGGQYRWCREGTATTNFTFTPSSMSANCSSLAEGSWNQADSLVISGSPSGVPPGSPLSSGSFPLTFYVRDNSDSSGLNDNIVQKTFVVTINGP